MLNNQEYYCAIKVVSRETLTNINNQIVSRLSKFSSEPYSVWAFCQPKMTGEGGGGQNGPGPNFAISSQMTMKLGKDIL